MKGLKVGAKFQFSPDKAAERSFREKVREACAAATVWNVQAPEGVRASLWREADGALVAQFLNLTGVANVPGEIVTPYAPKEAFPKLAENVEFELASPNETKAIATSPDFYGERQLKISTVGQNRVKVLVPKELLTTYVLVRLTHSTGWQPRK